METTSSHLQQAKEYQKNKQFELAINEFTKAIQVENNNLEAYYWRGFCFYQISEMRKAVEDFNISINLKPDYGKAYYWRALAYLKMGEKDQALSNLNQAIILNPNDVICYYRRAEIFNFNEDLDNAQQDLEKVIQLNPNYIAALFLFGKIKYQLGDNQGVLEKLNKLIELKNDYPEAYILRAKAKLKLKNFEDSLADLEKAEQIYQVQGDHNKQEEIQELINSVNQEIEVLNNHVSIKTLDSINLDKQRKKLDELIKKDNPIVYRFERELIKTYLKKNEMKYLQDSEGDFVLKFDYDPQINCELTVYLMVSGKNQNIYSISIRSNKRIPREKWNDAFFICNQWNLHSRWPSAFFVIRNEEDKYGFIVLEYHLDLEAGIHQQLLDNITSEMIASGYKFWYSTQQYF
jgi:tetratricopeptide (TPR) repeat protein